MKEYFRHGNNLILISGHRGGMENGFPENSIEALENTVNQIPQEIGTLFEIDPRLTKDSVIVLFHDETLERTSNGKGKLIDLTLKEVKNLRLKDKEGNITGFTIPTLEEAIQWAKGKTVLNLDKKDVPMQMTAQFLIEHNALGHVMVTVHSPEQALYYLSQDSRFMFSAFIRNMEELESYEKARIPFNQLMAYVGPLSKPENKELYQALNGRGAKAMVSAAPSYDKETNMDQRAVDYIQVFADGAEVLESDYPIAVSEALRMVKVQKR
ncbi:glycerophosphodiester phosphodiesterase family protein [Algoriphagus sp. PAP.12]|uniref:glycerophosphodiester phosphodiesterase family protein n=1 Tax=Algoriphagus sp. PAP.12 TaxID=2996678 RepID=UPI00227ABCC3|nr:glycerophosphodiester phosphodiesterase family protein [Algoriphagus sp. PAP.12]